MNPINFLPQSYRCRLRTRRRRVREATVVALLAGVLAVTWAYGLSERMDLRQSALDIENRLANALSTEQQVAELKELKERLAEQRRVQRKARMPIRHYQVVKVLGSLMPESTALVSLTLENQRPAPEPYRAAGADGGDDSGPAFSAQARSRAQRDAIELRMEALSPDDLTVAALIASLSEHPLFGEVKLQSTRYVEDSGVAARRFRLTASVDLSRDYRWVEATEQTEGGDGNDQFAGVGTQEVSP